MDLKGFVDRAKEAANTAAQKAQEAANAISSARNIKPSRNKRTQSQI